MLAGIDALTGLGALSAFALQMDASTLLLSQIGTDNRAFVAQAAGSFARIAQNGTGNTVTLIQR